MLCPFCHINDNKVIDSRYVDDNNTIRRRRECLHCGERFTTYERVELALPVIIKKDGRRSEFKEEKIRHGLRLALEKRPISAKVIETIIAKIKRQLLACGEREVPAIRLGEWIMDELKAIDQVAYVRFASVYRDFKDVEAFRREIDELLIG